MTEKKPPKSRKKNKKTEPTLVAENKVVKLNKNTRWIHDSLRAHSNAKRVVLLVEYDNGEFGYSYKNCSYKDIIHIMEESKLRFMLENAFE
jgi:hypothetical protein